MIQAIIDYKGRTYKVNLTSPFDLSLTLRSSKRNVRAWYVDSPKIEPVRYGKKVFEVKAGAPVNFRNVFFNPHGHTTHTESAGHITGKHIPLNRCLNQFFFSAWLISVHPEKQANGDRMIMPHQIKSLVPHSAPDALIIRTLPNSRSKQYRHYSGKNPPYLHVEAATAIRKAGIRHLIIDLPSVDREEDGGLLLAHRAFWNHPKKTRTDCTITELAYIPDEVKDGFYFLNLVPANFDNDAAPSRPLLYDARLVS